MPNVPILRPASLVLLAAAPALAQVKVQVTAPAEILFEGSTLPCTGRVTGATNPAVTWSVTRDHAPVVDAMPQPGLFLAPAGPPACYRIRATSVEDPNAFDEITVAVMPLVTGSGGEVVKGVDDLVKGYLGQRNPAHHGMPFLDPETGRRYDEQALVQVVPRKYQHLTRILGYGIPASVPWAPVLAKAPGLWLSYRAGGDVVRVNPSGQDHQELTLTGWVRDAKLEMLLPPKPGGNAAWQSSLFDLNFQVRGVVPFAGRYGYGPAYDAGHEDGVGERARFTQPLGLARWRHSEDGFLVADAAGHVLRSVAANGDIKTLCGKAMDAGFQDGAGDAAKFQDPTFLAGPMVHSDAILVADTGNHAIRCVTQAGSVTTLAGTGKAGCQDGPGRTATFDHPQGLAMDLDENVFVADAGNRKIRRIDARGVVSTLAGSGAKGSADGVADQASFTALRGMAYTHHGGLLYVLDQHALRRIKVDTGEVTTIIGQVETPGFLFEGEFRAAASPPALRDPCGLTYVGYHHGAERLLIADQGNHAIRVVDVRKPWAAPSYRLTTLVGDPAWTGTRWGLFRDGLPWAAGAPYAALASPRGMTRGPHASILVSNGNGLTLLAWPHFPNVPETTREARLDPAPDALKAGGMATLGFRIRDPHDAPPMAALGSPLPGAKDALVVVYRWTLALVDPKTGRPLADPKTGKDLVLEGRCHAGQHAARIALPGAGTVEARLTVVSDEGITLHDVQTWTVHA